MIARLPSLPLLFLVLPLLWLGLVALPARAHAAPVAPPCHHAQVQMQMRAGHAGVHAAGHAAHAARHDHARCTSCPACCAGAAPAPAALTAPLDAGPPFVPIPFRAGHLPSVDPSLPERPPRPSFA